ncbi:hypothetical protein C8R43DRAFT_1038788 [Mycena crocata]|nr:hypothetical protein C8R43DRAFT_1038788 [Mycena crocata]
MSKRATPVINTFRLPSSAVQTFIPLCFIGYCTLFPKDSDHAIWAPARYVYDAGLQGDNLIKFFALGGLIHGSQALYTLTLVRQYVGNFTTGAAYFFSTLAFGYPIWMDLRQRIADARSKAL